MQELKKYYQMQKNNLIELFNTSAEKGLNYREANKRLRKYGENKLPDKNSSGPLSIILDQFNDFMIIVLMVATVLSLFMGEIGDAITIFSIVILNAIMGFIQEYKAEKALAELKKMAAPQAKTLRDEEIVKVSSDQLVPGDIILLEMGDKVPADARILEQSGLQVNESLLTGESIPVNKKNEILYADNLSPGDQTNMLFMGTTVTKGNTKAIIVNTGLDTQMGKIADLLEDENRGLTPLQKRLKHLGKWLVIISIIITILITLIGIIKGQSIYQMFLAGISLAVAAIPEGLPAIVTLALAIGVQKMINKNAIVRKLPAVETLGCATVICSDKTGTLTQNKMTLQKVFINKRVYDFQQAVNSDEFRKLLKIGAICNGSQMTKKEKNGPINRVKEIFTGKNPPAMLGDPTDIALVNAVYEYDYTLPELEDKYEVITREDFISSRKRMSVLIKKSNDKKELWVKGAPEVILNLCRYCIINGRKVELNTKLKKEILQANNSMAEEALRVLALAYRPINQRVRKDNDIKQFENNLILVGMTGLMDPPRPEVYDAVQECHTAGIKPLMITGDHKLTAKIIARDVGIIDKYGEVIDGTEISNMSEKHLESLIKNRRVFARVSPGDKLKIVKLLQKQGEIVAMTGDGVNDAPAIKKADIGIAMGKKGTDVTKEVSSLVLSDDNFATIVAAIKEGRKIYNNIRKFIRYLLSCNVGELLSIFMGITLGLPIPLIPIQILWVNLVTDGLPALALGMEDEGDEVMKKKPRDPEESIFADGMAGNIASQGVLIGISTLLAFLLGIYRFELDIPTARTMAFSTLVFSQLFFVFNCRSEEHSFWEINPFSNLYLLGAVALSSLMQLAVIYQPFLASFFKTGILNLEQWIVVMVLSTWSTIILEIIQRFIRSIR